LASNGANWVINDFSNVTADQAIAFFSDPARAA
jgi:hypothetical protein